MNDRFAESNKMDIFNEIKSLLDGDVSREEEDIVSHSRDTSLFEVRPDIVAYPKNNLDISRLVSYVSRLRSEGQSVSLTARSGGSDMTGGPLTESIVIDFTRYMNSLSEMGNDYAVVEPGMYYRDFEKETLRHNLLMPSFPASRDLCAIGGMVGNNAGGEKTLAYGKVEDFVEELHAVLADGKEYVVRPLDRAALQEKLAQDDFEGELYRNIYELVVGNHKVLKSAKPNVSKNSSGYYLWNVWDGSTFDLTKLLVGSQGTLGIITKVKLRLVKPANYSKLLVVFLRDLDSLGDLVNKTLLHKPETFESYDDHTLQVAMRFLPQLVHKLKGNLLMLGLQFLPELGMIIRGGIPKLVLTAEFNGYTPQEAYEKARLAQIDLAQFRVSSRIAKTDLEAQKYKTIRRESFNLLRQRIKDKSTVPAFEDIIVRPDQLPQFLPELTAILDGYHVIYTIAGHVGDANFHIIPLMDLSSEHDRKLIPEMTARVFELVFKYGGSMSAEHNDGLVRTPYLPQMFGEEVYSLFIKTKNIFDPLNIFNPGKKVNSVSGSVWSKMKRI